MSSCSTKISSAAKLYLEKALMPTMVAIDSPEGKMMVSTLKDKFQVLGEPYPAGPMTTMQVQTLLNVFVNYPLDKNKEIDQKMAIKAAMASFGMPATEVNNAEGAVQIEEQVYAKLTSLGLETPPAGTLSFDNLSKIKGIFDGDGTDESKKAAAMLVLSGK